MILTVKILASEPDSNGMVPRLIQIEPCRYYTGKSRCWITFTDGRTARVLISGFRVAKKCLRCGTKFETHDLNRLFCTASCRTAKESGRQAWRIKVLQRDGNRCVLCGSDTDLEADHIKPWALYPDLRFDPDNGRTLCRPCHIKTPTFGRGTRRA